MTKLRNVAAATLSTLCAALLTGQAQAGDLNSVGSLTQDQFKSLSKDLGAIVSYKGVTPATPLGLVGLDMGVEFTSTKLEHKGVFTQAGGSSSSSVIVPKLHVHKGLPGGLDIGGFLSKVDDANISLLGLEARYALLDDGLTTPAIGLRVAGTRENGVSQIDLSTLSFDVVVSKKLTLITPFAGVGTVKVKSQPNAAGLAEEKFNSSRVFVGLNANFALMNVAVEAEKQGDNTSISAKAGFRF